MPAVDYRMPEGLSWHDLGTALAIALQSGRAMGLEITIFNPRLDRDGAAGMFLGRYAGRCVPGLISVVRS